MTKFYQKGRDIRIEYIQPGKPQQNVYVGRFNVLGVELTG